jgi:hypothetical protein
MVLTGLALFLLAYWEFTISEIPLGLFSIRHSNHGTVFTVILVAKLLTATVLISRGLLRLWRQKNAVPHPHGLSTHSHSLQPKG